MTNYPCLPNPKDRRTSNVLPSETWTETDLALMPGYSVAFELDAPRTFVVYHMGKRLPNPATQNLTLPSKAPNVPTN